MTVFEQMESEVRSYCRSFPVVFDRAKGSRLYSEDGRAYLDFFAGAGAINYGHNNDYIKRKVIDFYSSDRVVHALDMSTEVKADFLGKFRDRILRPRGLDYKVMFCGPTGTNAVESALKLARKVKRREYVFSFMGAFHGMTTGSLALTANRSSREGAGVTLDNVYFLPPFRGFVAGFDALDHMEYVLRNDHSGVPKPAAVVIETIQAEGGIVEAGRPFLQRLRALCDAHDILLIVDDIQVGCGRTGHFFSFEDAGIVPDMVTLSKSISGYGMPMALLLLRPELDIWTPGEHNGTFRGYQPAFVGAAAAIDFLESSDLLTQVKAKEGFVRDYIAAHILPLDAGLVWRGKGLIHGLDFEACGGGERCGRVARACFARGLVIERAGKDDGVLKLLPPLTTSEAELEEGLEIIKAAIQEER